MLKERYVIFIFRSYILKNSDFSLLNQIILLFSSIMNIFAHRCTISFRKDRMFTYQRKQAIIKDRKVHKIHIHFKKGINHRSVLQLSSLCSVRNIAIKGFKITYPCSVNMSHCLCVNARKFQQAMIRLALKLQLQLEILLIIEFIIAPEMSQLIFPHS